MSERQLWRHLSKLVPHTCHFTRHEDKLQAGIPDLSYGWDGVNGWIELKYIKKWPTRVDTPVLKEYMTVEQRNWIYDRGCRGGHAFVLAHIGRDYLIFGHKSCAYEIDFLMLNKEELINQALKIWKRMDVSTLKEILC